MWEWHLPKSGRIPNNKVDVFGRTMWEEETKCGETIPKDRLRTYDQFRADKGANPEMWCPRCFLGL